MVVPPNHPKCWSFLVGKPMVVGETHHFRNPPYTIQSPTTPSRDFELCHGRQSAVLLTTELHAVEVRFLKMPSLVWNTHGFETNGKKWGKKRACKETPKKQPKMLQGVNPYLIVGKICAFWGYFITEVVWAVPPISLISTTSDNHLLLWPLMVDWKAMLPQRSAQEPIICIETKLRSMVRMYIYMYILYILCTYYIYIYYVHIIYIYISFHVQNMMAYSVVMWGEKNITQNGFYFILLMEEIRLTSWYAKYPSICRVFSIATGAGFLPSTVL